MTHRPDPSVVPTEHANPSAGASARVVVVNTGDGKGKSTVGVRRRACAASPASWQVAVVQFLKSGKWHVGEEKVCRDRLGVDWFAIGEGFTWDSDDLTEDEAVAQEAWRHAAGDHRGRRAPARRARRDHLPDELGVDRHRRGRAPSLRGRPEKVNVVCTGRDAPAALVDVADTVTEMRKVKHAYDTGVRAKKGIDY